MPVSGEVEIIGVRISSFDERAYKPSATPKEVRQVNWGTPPTESETEAITASRAVSKSPSPAMDRKGKVSKTKPELPMKDGKDCEYTFAFVNQ